MFPYKLINDRHARRNRRGQRNDEGQGEGQNPSFPRRREPRTWSGPAPAFEQPGIGARGEEQNPRSRAGPEPGAGPLKPSSNRGSGGEGQGEGVRVKARNGRRQILRSRDAETERQSPSRWSRAYAPAALVSVAVLAAVLAVVLATALFTTAISRADGPPRLGRGLHPALQTGAGTAGPGQGFLRAQAAGLSDDAHAAAHGYTHAGKQCGPVPAHGSQRLPHRSQHHRNRMGRAGRRRGSGRLPTPGISRMAAKVPGGCWPAKRD